MVISIVWNSILVHSRSGAGCLGAQTFTETLNSNLYTILVAFHVFEIFCKNFLISSHALTHLASLVAIHAFALH